MKLTSTAFQNDELIPQKYGQDFEDINPPLTIQDIPEGTKSLALLMDDPDIPESAGIPVWDHWVVFNISPAIMEIKENWNVKGIRGKGTRGYLNYSGPKPPDREHRYFFKLYALDNTLNLAEGATKIDVERAMEGHVLEHAVLMGRYAPSTKIRT